MKRFKQFLKESKVSEFNWFTLKVDEYFIHILVPSPESRVLEEAKYRGTPLGGPYSAKSHPPHTPVDKYHLHVYINNNQLFALNKDGTAHDQSHGVRMPNKVAKAITQKFPDFILPKNNLIESAPRDIIELFREQILFG